MDKNSNINILLDLEVVLTSQIHNLVNEYVRNDVPDDYLEQAKRVLWKNI